jgi:hypothetical protein
MLNRWFVITQPDVVQWCGRGIIGDYDGNNNGNSKSKEGAKVRLGAAGEMETAYIQ